MPYGQPTYGPYQNFGPQNFVQPVPNYGPQTFEQPYMQMPQPADAPPPPNAEMGRKAGQGTGFTPTPQCVKCAEWRSARHRRDRTRYSAKTSSRTTVKAFNSDFDGNYITVRLGSESIDALIDTGAVRSLINEQTARV